MAGKGGGGGGNTGTRESGVELGCWGLKDTSDIGDEGGISDVGRESKCARGLGDVGDDGKRGDFGV